MKEKVLVAMSGGTDSTAAAVLLKNEYDIAGCTMWLIDTDQARQDIADAAAVCERLGIEHFVADLRDTFRKEVIDRFAAGYVAGQTPNPCLVCNKHIKFGALLDFAKSHGFSKIATGHYVKKVYENGRWGLVSPADAKKDQTYVLYSLSQEQLEAAIFPLGDTVKSHARELAKSAGLDRNRDSQDICFVPDGDYAGFIERHLGRSDIPGDFVTAAGEVMGRHKGIWHYTVGQRKGLGVGFGKPMYVVGKDAESRRVILGDNADLFASRVRIADVNYLGIKRPDAPVNVQAKIRYSTVAAPALLCPDGDEAVLEFEQPQRAPSPGQAAVFYSGNALLGGGIIVGKED